ncbi:MAG: hypothetical protein KDH96_02525 [Candidatus Riesia sp.]|nr:hypothetical protein [Candidatus Riesia sp.]
MSIEPSNTTLTNSINFAALLLGGLTITEKISFLIGVSVLITALIFNIVGIKAKREELKNNKAQKEYYENKLKEEKEQNDE